MRSFLYATTALVSLVFATTAEAGIGCTPPPTGGSAPRLDTMVADSVDITGGCISGAINGQTYYAPAFRGAVSKQYCTWDATHDVGDCINAAVAAARAAGAGVVDVPAGTYGVSTTISQTDTMGVVIRGAGGIGHHGVFKTKLKWIGSTGATMVQIGADAATTRVVGAGLKGIYLDGNSLAATGLSTRSVVWLEIRDLVISGVTATGWDHGVSTTANVGSTRNRVYDTYIAVTGTAKGLKWSGTTTNNVHHDDWYNLHIQHADGTGFECGNSDSNKVYGFYAQRTAGSGLSLDLLASDTVDNECRSNYLFAAEPQGGVTARATGFARPSSDNYIQINKESANIIPTVESGATLLCDNNQGNQCGTALGTYAIATLTLTNALGTASGGTGDTGSAWSTYTPTVSCGGGTITTLGAVAGQYKTLGKTVFVEIQIPITTVGTCTGQLSVSLPAFPVSATGKYHLHGREDGSSGAALVGLIDSAVHTNNVLIWKYDGTTCAASGAQCNVGGTYQRN